MTDRVTDMLVRIKNAYLARQEVVVLPHFSFGQKLAEVLKERGFLSYVKVEKGEKEKILKIGLVYRDKKPVLSEIKMISKPSIRIYVKAQKIKKVLGGLGESFISTPQGLMTGEEAKKKNLGGELICEVW